MGTNGVSTPKTRVTGTTSDKDTTVSGVKRRSTGTQGQLRPSVQLVKEPLSLRLRVTKGFLRVDLSSTPSKRTESPTT